MIRKPLMVVLLGLFILVIGACSNQGTSPIVPVQPEVSRVADYMPDEYCGDETTIDLIAGQHTVCGEVIVTNDENNLYIDIVMFEPWELMQAHIAVSDSPEGFPQTKKGNPKPGQFPYDENSIIDISQWECGTQLYIAVHAVVKGMGENGEYREETGWGEGEGFPGKNWAMYFGHEIQCCFKAPSLPPAGTEADLWIYPGVDAYIDVHLYDVPTAPDGVDPYEVWDGTWPGWCTDKYHTIYYHPTNPYWYYDFPMFSSYEPELWPDGLKTIMGYGTENAVEWDKINYLINHKQGNAEDVQSAIWWFSDGAVPTTVGQLIVDEANANGDGWYPVAGEYMALLFYKPGVQAIFIEVDP